ncbi:MAG: hypothetical protein DRJ30_03820 [Candidatus Methanomethylicota archaeon]|nr:MAG: hypothetical protein DRJ30_03820 [Candidatus Verstraetearchaeota archaeon]
MNLENSSKREDSKFIYINPVETLPNHMSMRRGLLRDDVFAVVHETHWTETAKLADIVLPAPTYLEKEDIVIPYSYRYVMKSNSVIKPLGKSRSELWVAREIARSLGLKDEWLCEGSWSTLEKALNNAFENGDIIKLFNDLGKLNFKAIISKSF